MLVSRERPQRHGEFEAGVRVRDPPPRDRQGDRRQDGSGHGTGTVKKRLKGMYILILQWITEVEGREVDKWILYCYSIIPGVYIF